jgi:hypothetical protein
MLQQLIPILLVLFILYRVFTRIRRNIGWQQMNPVKMGIWSTVCFVFSVLLLFAGGLQPVNLVSEIAGLLVGGALAYYGAKLTTFEQQGGKLLYRANIWMGSLVTVITLVRIGYRFYEMFADGMSGGLQNMKPSITGSASWTTGFMLIMFAYYVTYYGILLVKHRNSNRSAAVK